MNNFLVGDGLDLEVTRDFGFVLPLDVGMDMDTPLNYNYRNLQVEVLDPFYDRDYNLCIVCDSNDIGWYTWNSGWYNGIRCTG